MIGMPTWLRGARAGWVLIPVIATACGTPTATPSATPSLSPMLTPIPPVSATPSDAQPGAFPVAFFAPDFAGPASRTFSQQYIADMGGFVEVTYPAGSSAPSSGKGGGAQAKLAIAAGSSDDATLTYQLRFPVGFDWVKGGKLPGLCGGKCWTGSDNGPGGWAARLMWRTGGAGEVLLSDATTSGYGSDLGLGDWHFAADGQWHTLTEHVHLNTAGEADGYIDVTYDGMTVAQLTGITFRAAGDTDQIDSLMFSTFFGGHDSSWAPPTTTTIDFAKFSVTLG